MPRIPTKSPTRPWVAPREAHAGRKRKNSKFYNSTAWRKTRAQYLLSNPLCKFCFEKKEYVGAKVVDHIIPINQGGDPLDPGNFQGLCDSCHNKKSGREGAAVTNAKFKEQQPTPEENYKFFSIEELRVQSGYSAKYKEEKQVTPEEDKTQNDLPDEDEYVPNQFS